MLYQGEHRQAEESNRYLWDEMARVHIRAYKEVQLLRDGAEILDDIELGEVGDVDGKRLLHLQCHTGRRRRRGRIGLRPNGRHHHQDRHNRSPQYSLRQHRCPLQQPHCRPSTVNGPPTAGQSPSRCGSIRYPNPGTVTILSSAPGFASRSLFRKR